MQDFGMFSMTSNFDNEAGNPKITHAHQESRITPESLYQHRTTNSHSVTMFHFIKILPS